MCHHHEQLVLHPQNVILKRPLLETLLTEYIDDLSGTGLRSHCQCGIGSLYPIPSLLTELNRRDSSYLCRNSLLDIPDIDSKGDRHEFGAVRLPLGF